ncbi:acyl-CoA synthetase/AMP-acid ligase [Hoeflea sp. IMCC20628]|uniref:AMP-binding protein n=1 Tax=Hoeflea sp. IMCC20628 TaxID=1620421 RepID=UPI00063ADCC4|nr:AMP-binding protein [Hoeflea sp. IMCC20628]AKI03260.1 acyl-CoA synthetase/AMP-acid ligase [Hoeflea sp. IMCC20628]
MLLPAGKSLEDISSRFSWDVPEFFNIGSAVSDDWAAREPDRICLEHFNPDGEPAQLSYVGLARRSNAFARGLRSLGVKSGDRVALMLPQGFETAIAHVAIYKLGAVAVPLALLFGVEAVEHRLTASGAVALVTTGTGLGKVVAIRERLTALETIIVTDNDIEGSDAVSFDALENGHSDAPIAVVTRADDPALMIFTSGTTGPPKGALHGHRVLIGHIPGVQTHHEFMPQPGDKLWTPADWAWAGGLLNVLLPGLLLGVPVVSSRAQKFDPELAYRIMAEMDVRNVFIPPTALRIMRTVADPLSRHDLRLRTIGSGGEALGRETYDWAQRVLGLTINEFYGQTECNLVLASCAQLGVSRGGAIGKPVPGHQVAVIDDQGKVVPDGISGQIAVKRPDPVMFLGYWQNEAATEAKYIGDWMLTGDQGVRDADGYFSFFGRDDDVITSSGYRIGPGEIEDCLTGHPAVVLAAAVGKPDAIRTEIVKAYVVVAPGITADAELAVSVRDWVKTRLSAHEYPREIEFVDSLPLTTTGKVIRRELRDRAIAEVAAAGASDA